MRRTRFLVPVFALFLAACPEPPSDRVQLAQAAVLAQEGDIQGAREKFEGVLERDPNASETLLRYGAFLVEHGPRERAEQFIARLEATGLRGTDLGRLDTLRRDYFQAVYDDAEAGAPVAPADPAAYERGILGLLGDDTTGPLVNEYHAYLIAQARRAIGVDPAVPVEDAQATASSISGSAAREALGYLDRLGAPVREVSEGSGAEEVPVRLVDDVVASEAAALREALRVALFDAEFDRRWSTRFRDAFVRDGRFDREDEVFILSFEGPRTDDAGADAAIARLSYLAQTHYARDLVSGVVFELTGETTEAPLPYVVADFATTEIEALEGDAERIAFRARVPYVTVRRGAWLLAEAE